MKKKIIAVFSGALLVVTLAGCSGYDTGDTVMGGNYKVVGDKGYYDVLRDVKTGCYYLESHTSSGLTPYYDKDGKVKGCGENVGEEF